MKGEIKMKPKLSGSYIRWILLVLTALVLSACAYNSPPVEVVGNKKDLSMMKGDWRGEYSSSESGRKGNIIFTLSADSDTAHGDIMMYAHSDELVYSEENKDLGKPILPAVLTIRFVQIRKGWVTGMLDPYRDPECGCILETTFIGKLKGATIEGTYSTQGVEHDLVQEGSWFVKRKD